MILRPRCAPPGGGDAVSAWQAVEKTQKSAGEAFSFITQPEHAVLAGDLAARFTRPPYPALSDDAVRAIAWHDKGWEEFDFAFTGLAAPQARRTAPPRSFIAMGVTEFLVAWTRSIEQCETISPAAGWMVSAHFVRLAQYRLRLVGDTAENTRRIHGFLEREGKRAVALARQSGLPGAVLDGFLDVLQFCDLLSLYLCCGASETVEFPQKFGGVAVRLRFEDGAYALSPSPFAAGADLGINAWKYPAEAAPQPLGFLLR